MEFRQIVQSVCRSAAARPSLLASTRPFPSAILLQQSQFSTSTRLLSEAAAEAPRTQGEPSSTEPSRPFPPTHSARSGQTTLPPRPPPIRRNSLFIDEQQKHGQTQHKAGSSGSSATADPYQLPSLIRGDMEKSTGGLSTWDESDFLKRHFSSPQPDPRMRPSTGRTISLRQNVDVARAFHLLERTVARNGMRRDARRQRQHERPALKRKRQWRERWRARFKDGMRAVINRTMELRAQGW
ncbi:37S ribosomal protein mrp21, mitochondrial [Madurella fahalii]|uniref:37S ribosomal protein mrp21, mitochondrial n=1 Tax=Madurella fahalii TaxID=1157608 RepID=A0ABQ0GNA7_9PEZI